MPKIALWMIALAAALAGGCARKEVRAVEAVEAPAVRARVERVTPEAFAVTVAITGTLVSTTRVDVKAETTGKIVRFAKQEGDRAAAGEPVVWVDDSNEKILLKQTETAVQVAEAALDRAKVMESHSRSEYERAQNLLKSGGITDRDYKAAELAERDSRAQVALAAAQLEQARAHVDQARKMVRDSVVHSPVAGEIQTRYVNEGAYVEAPTPLFSIVDNSRLELESMLPTADLAAVRAGQRAAFTVNAYPDQTFEGHVIEVNPAVQADTRSAKVRIQVVNAGGRLKAGMYAQGAIQTGVQAQAIVIPAAAVYRDDRSAKTSYVFVVENAKAARRNVRIGRERDSVLEIVEGLTAGDVVVAGQSIEIAEGVRIEPNPNGK